MAKQIPSTGLFIIRTNTDDKAEVSRHLLSLGKLEELKGSDALLLHVAESYPDVKSTWQHIRSVLGPGEIVQPVLLDERGYRHYPTGEISVRFGEALSDKQLQQFAASHGLKLRNRNEFVPEQAVFCPVELEPTYLPDLVQEIATQKNVSAVWANTLSHYERVQSSA